MMKTVKTKPFILIGILFITLLVILWYLGGKVAGPEDMASIPQVNDMPAHNDFNLVAHIRSIDPVQIKEKFPYTIYLDSADYDHYSSLQSHIQALDSINPNDKMGNLEILSIALTEKLLAKTTQRYKTYCPDTLLALLQWAEKFKIYGEADQQHAILFNSVYSYWLDMIANKLNTFYEHDRSLKYAPKFNYMATRCYEQKFSVPIDNSRFEKIVQYFSETQFAYLYNRFWNGTSIWVKTGILALILFTLYGYYLLISRIIIYFKTK
jgi:hypothetical protein